MLEEFVCALFSSCVEDACRLMWNAVYWYCNGEDDNKAFIVLVMYVKYLDID